VRELRIGPVSNWLVVVLGNLLSVLSGRAVLKLTRMRSSGEGSIRFLKGSDGHCMTPAHMCCDKIIRDMLFYFIDFLFFLI